MEDHRALEQLADQQRRLKETAAYIPGLVVQARYAGESWAAVASALGCSRQEAFRKYAKICDPSPQPPAPPAAG